MINKSINEYNPDYVSPPGESLAETLESLAMSPVALAKKMDIPVRTVSDIIIGKTELTPEIALQLEKILHIPARFWNNRERLYREFLAQKAGRLAVPNPDETKGIMTENILCS
ncbi:MAG: helix-turn-helix domain-containing protein [Desulfobacterales bacterium]|nr:helix-turn-helix domain-containing protein [Desulfobacterales bacterium]